MARMNASAFYPVGNIGFGRHPQDPKTWIAVDTNDKNKVIEATILEVFTDGKSARAWCEEKKGEYGSTASSTIKVGQKVNEKAEEETTSNE